MNTVTSQEQGAIGRLVGSMIRRSVRKRYRGVYWRRATEEIRAPAILYANHHSWMDGYLMFHVAQHLGLACIDWIEEFDAFPLFRFVGGMPFPRGKPSVRAATIRATIRSLNHGGSLVIFPEGVLHRPPEIQPLGEALAMVARNVPRATLIPVAIYQEMSIHERPEAWISLETPHTFGSLADCRERLSIALQSLRTDVGAGSQFDILAHGTPSVNERMSMRRLTRT